MLYLQGVTYIHPNRDLLFSDVNLNINKNDKIALIGNNGTGKSTLLKILAGKLQATIGSLKTGEDPYYVPQHFGQFNNNSIAEVLQIADKLTALAEILKGHATDENLTVLNDDWTIEERCATALAYWNLASLDLNQPLETLSGGQKTRAFLAGIIIHQPQLVLLDEPTNHLDSYSRNTLYDYIKSTKNTLIVVSHDRTLLNLLNCVCELSKNGIISYGGNYDFYTTQKAIAMESLNQGLRNKEKTLRKAKETERESIERQQKLDAKGKKKQEKAGLPTISINTLKNNAERSTAKLKGVHIEKISSITEELHQLRLNIPDRDKMKVNFIDSDLHQGKILVSANAVNFGYNHQLLWKDDLSFQIKSGDRIAIKGTNGSGKTTLIRLILGQVKPISGTLETITTKAIYIDQDYSLINNQLSVYEQAQSFNTGALQEHEIKIRLNRFLFTKEYWDKPCSALSGGEKMRLILCSFTINNTAPDLIILDEPTNNLDIQNLEVLTDTINEYKGTLLVVSHDEYFLKQVNIELTINL
ncbi:ABC-F family ATP-binding cassette domain-containing protein [Pedobacter frigiditerrae]|uniref:ABC-F family ATP-binding cassette domain-containing protein n=1 Tax=Pedobacter frigiditerrae TaxID=2530452 RepID=A0A4R0N513_9SPHI|nr:ABC-F family ATP-binding cassette domain-containing protein [Pedobacter frigiditerrae]TCC93662.1 ABC-F family ATP-binding cassette domain-containing protein [Pedobacter frigiditerrae]